MLEDYGPKKHRKDDEQKDEGLLHLIVKMLKQGTVFKTPHHHDPALGYTDLDVCTALFWRAGLPHRKWRYANIASVLPHFPVPGS